MVFSFPPPGCIIPESSSNCFRPGLFSGQLSGSGMKCVLTSMQSTIRLSRTEKTGLYHRKFWSSTCLESSRTPGDQSLPAVSPNFCADWRDIHYPSNFLHNDFGASENHAWADGYWLACDAALFSELNFLHYLVLYGESGLPNCQMQRLSASCRLKHANCTATHL